MCRCRRRIDDVYLQPAISGPALLLGALRSSAHPMQAVPPGNGCDKHLAHIAGAAAEALVHTANGDPNGDPPPSKPEIHRLYWQAVFLAVCLVAGKASRSPVAIEPPPGGC